MCIRMPSNKEIEEYRLKSLLGYRPELVGDGESDDTEALQYLCSGLPIKYSEETTDTKLPYASLIPSNAVIKISKSVLIDLDSIDAFFHKYLTDLLSYQVIYPGHRANLVSKSEDILLFELTEIKKRAVND